ncbi:MAG: MBL fold metallo-hydrolase, partial [Chloroflexi bacterium]|nr:MBL fold metallo-hydrolase [Chloroflexota bacterium]
AHADRDELYGWLSNCIRPPKEVFIVHGEPDVAEKFKLYLSERTGWKISVPNYLDEVVLQ